MKKVGFDSEQVKFICIEKMPKRWRIILLLLYILVLEECLAYLISTSFMNTGYLPEWNLILCCAFVATSLVYFFRKLPYQKVNIKSGIAFFFIAYLCVLTQKSLVWVVSTFPLTDVNTVLFTLQMPIDGFVDYYVKKYIDFIPVDSLKITLLFYLFLILGLRKNCYRYCGLICYFVCSICFLFYKLPVGEYIITYKNYNTQHKLKNSILFEEEYIHPNKVIVTPPTSRRNLVLIFLESMETTFSDLTPELNLLAKQNLSFGEKRTPIGGGDDVFGTGFTFGAYVAKTAGIPIFSGNSYRNGYKGFKSLYDFLHEQNYRQYIVLGTSIGFAGTDQFLQNRGIDEIYDYENIITEYSIDRRIVENRAFRSVSDRHTFSFTKSVLDTIKEPFSLTLFTIDTHTPDGMYDERCENNFWGANESETYKSIVQCTSALTADFIDYLKKKDFYENTTIVIVGDHNFMGKHLVQNKSNRKWINIFLNSVKVPVNSTHYFSDMDMYPTILSALGYEIEGNRLGFGVNLFSNEKTLLEMYGADSLNKLIREVPSSIEFNRLLWAREHE